MIPNEIVACAGDNLADADTDLNGQTTFTSALVGGGFTETGLRVFIDGIPIPDALGIEVNGPDLTRDLEADLADMGVFVGDWFQGPPTFRADLHRDGVIDIVDALFVLPQEVSPCAP